MHRAPPLTAPAVPPAGWRIDRENNRGLQPAGDITLLRWPFPYRAALAVSNDTDGMSVAAFADLHDFVNGTGMTPYGEGCGLEMGDSFWIWSERGQFSLHHGMPHDAAIPPSPEQPLLAELGRAGWLDTLHGFGAWTEPWTIGRREAEQGLELLDRLGMTPALYVNHGGSNPLHGGGGRMMAHNFGGPWGWYQRGDLPGDRSYCLDLLRAAGFQFFWPDVAFELQRFGEDRTYRNQSVLDREVAVHDFARWFRRRTPAGDGREQAFPDLRKKDVLALRERFFNRLVFPVTARDGREVLCFKRYRGEEGPMAANFAVQVTAGALDQLEAREAGVVVYQHFGIWRPLGAGKGSDLERQSVPPVLDVHGVWAFRELARRQRESRILVTTAARLLRYAWLRDHLVWHPRPRNEVLTIRLEHVDCPAYGRQPMDPDLLQGLSFRIPKGYHVVRLDVAGLAEPPALDRHELPGDGAAEVVSVPLRRLEWAPIGPRVAAFEAHPTR